VQTSDIATTTQKAHSAAASEPSYQEPQQEPQDAAEEDLDFNAVQRGDAEMENRMNRLVRACAELGERNPILSIHDQVASAVATFFPCRANSQ
jgi:hypothetical protein